MVAKASTQQEFQQGADVVLETGNPISAGTTGPYVEALGEVAELNNLVFVNSHDEPDWTDFTTASGNGYMNDTLHPSPDGYNSQSGYLYAQVAADL